MLTDHMVDEQVQKEKLHTKQKEVEFKMLASQINPHFLYNTLETIRMKAVVNHQPEIVELVKMLAKTMRYNIQVTDRLVTLKEELQMVEYYLKIQEYRFGDRITSNLTVEPVVDSRARILPLTIQPFVENAFVHGLEGKDKDGRLEIRVYMEGDDLCICIRDNGAGMDYYELGALRKTLREEQADQSHIGMRNVNQRIKLLYGEKYGVEVDSQKNLGTTVIIRIPYRISDDEKL
jgi:two-component system sensor histidine kinase YesM